MDMDGSADMSIERAPSGGALMVGVYIDGMNLYYGGRDVVGRSAAGWRWLDLRRLSERLLARFRAG